VRVNNATQLTAPPRTKGAKLSIPAERLSGLLRRASLTLLAGTLGVLSAQEDPGIRGGPPGAGKPIPGLTAGDPQGRKDILGIRGHVNTNGNDGTVTRFGWKARNKSLLIFAGEAYNVEMGVTNDNFPNEREEDPNCAKNGTPESHPGFNVGSTDPEDILAFMGFMRFLDQPTPACTGSSCSVSIQNGHRLFGDIGCANCHMETHDRLFIQRGSQQG
jgi:hypothetical protein